MKNEGSIEKQIRLRSLLETAAMELHYLMRCDTRLFVIPLTAEQIAELPDNDELAERVDAFVARFGRLQDTLGDKLLPTFLRVMEEIPGTVLDNLDRAEKLGLIKSADVWLALRKLRNRMIHEYVTDPDELLAALVTAHQHISMLAEMLANIRGYFLRRFQPDI
ncbi:conserved hypothetical protein [Gammaproteobacteria bacterium]